MNALVVSMFTCLFLSTNQPEDQKADFNIEIQLPSTAPLEGPITLSVTITYRGEKTIRAISFTDEKLDVDFATPNGWQTRDKTSVKTLDGALPVTEITKGETFSNAIHLHDYFAKITPGKISLPVTFKIWPATIAGDEPLATIEKTISLEVIKTDKEKLGERIGAIISRIESEKNKGVKLRECRSLLGLSHPDLVSIFLRSLRDPDMTEIRSLIHQRLVDLAIQYDGTDSLIDYLAANGNKHDSAIFELWKVKGIKLTEAQSARLSRAENIWIMLYSLKYYPNQKSARNTFRSLQSEIDDISSKIREINKTIPESGRQ